MKLPHMKYSDSISKQTRVKFGGYNHSLYARDGDIYDMKNISSDYYPLISQRKQRALAPTPSLKVWSGKGYSFPTSNQIKIPTQIKFDISEKDKLTIKTTGTYADSSGDYVVSDISYDDYDSPSNTTITFYNASFTTSSAGIGDKDLELSIKGRYISQTVDDPQSNVECKKVTEDSDITQYTITNSGMTEVRTVKTSGAAKYNKKTTVSVYDIIYDQYTEYLNQDISFCGCSTLYCSNRTIFNSIKKCSHLYIINTDKNIYKDVYVKDIDVNNGYINITDEIERDDYIPSSYMYTIHIYTASSMPQPRVSESYMYYTNNNNSSTDKIVSNNDGTEYTNTKIEAAEYEEYDITTTITTTTYQITEPDVNIVSLGAGDKMYFVTDDGKFYYDGIYCGKLPQGKKKFAETGPYIYILPDNCYYNKNTSELVISNKNGARHQNTPRDNIRISDNSIQVTTVNFAKLAVNDVVNITISFTNEQENQTFTGTVKDYNGNTTSIGCINGGYGTDITFTEPIFKGVNEEYVMRIDVFEDRPTLTNICASNNRIWGHDSNTIYCTAFGEPLNWYKYTASSDGNDADVAWSVKPFDECGEFTGCTVYNNYPMFFKENKVYRVYGDKASNFELVSDDKPGVLAGSSKSIKIVDDILYYLSPHGIIRYLGNVATELSTEFFEMFYDGVAGTDGKKYYISMKSKNGYKLMVYDYKKKLWCVEDNLQVVDFAQYGKRLYALDNNHNIWCMNPGDDLTDFPLSSTAMTLEDDFESFIEFGDYYCDSPDKKGISKLFFRISIEANSQVELLINYDSERDENNNRLWQSVKTISTTNKKSFLLPVIPKRCDHFRIKLSGTGKYVLYSLSYEYYKGSEM